jgi:hypothetical protein
VNINDSVDETRGVSVWDRLSDQEQHRRLRY